METLLFAIIAYLAGSIPTALIIGLKFFNKDIRQFGSKNLGGTNAGRVLGKTTGLIVSILDILKVFLPALISKRFLDLTGVSIVGFAGMLGHCFPIFANFRGGKAVSSFYGMLFALNPYVAVIMLLFWNLLKILTNYVSLSSMIMSIAASVIYFVVYGSTVHTFVLFAAALFLIYRHRSNIVRLLNGTENKIRNN